MRGNFDVLTRGLVILVLAVAIYGAGSVYVISIYLLLRDVEDPSSVTLHRPVWLDSDKEEGGYSLWELSIDTSLSNPQQNAHPSKLL